MRARNKTAIVGQGPNQTCWEQSLVWGLRQANLHAGEFAGSPAVQEADSKVWAEQRTERMAITGRVGERLAHLLAQHRLKFYAQHDRFNLNRRWNGKQGAGDVFLRPEGLSRAMLIDDAGYRAVVMLGAEVTACFGWKWEPLATFASLRTPTRRLAFPHPSGLNRWWNEPGNPDRAAHALKTFLNL